MLYRDSYLAKNVATLWDISPNGLPQREHGMKGRLRVSRSEDSPRV